MIIELDGDQRQEKEQEKDDAIITQYLDTLDNKILRFSNNEGLTNLNSKLEKIKNNLFSYELDKTRLK